MIQVGIRELVEKQARDHRDKIAIIFQERTITFGQLRDDVFRLANGLLKQGVQKGDKVALVLPNWPEYVMSYLALF
jgi:long-chain acyl-CoA synthetase